MHGTLTANFRAASSSVAYTHLFTPQMTRAVRNKPLCESMDSGRSLQLTAIMVSVCIVDNGLGSNCIYTILSSPQEGQLSPWRIFAHRLSKIDKLFVAGRYNYYKMIKNSFRRII